MPILTGHIFLYKTGVLFYLFYFYRSIFTGYFFETGLNPLVWNLKFNKKEGRILGKTDLGLKLFTVFIPLILFVFLAAGNALSWRAARTLSFQLTRNQSAAAAEELALRMDLLVQKSSRGLALLSNLWREAPIANQRETFLKWANGLVVTDQIFDLVLYLDADNIMMVTPPSSSSTPLIGLDIQSRPAKEDLFKTLRKAIAPLEAPPTARITSQGALVLWFPVLVQSAQGQSMAGTVAGALRLKDLLEKTLTPLMQNEFWISIAIGGKEVFNTREEGSAIVAELQGEKNINLMGLDWQVKVWPKGGGVHRELAASDLIRLIMMVVLSLLASGLLGVSFNALHRVGRNQRRRQRSEKRYQTLFNSAIDGIMVLDPNGYVLDANPAVCTSLGYSLKALRFLNLSAVLGPDSLESLPDCLAKLKQQRPISCEMSHMTRDKSMIPVEMSARSFEFDGVPAILSMFRDISQRKQAIQALAESEQRFRAIFQQAGVGIMQCGPDYHIQHVNDKLCEILGYTREEVIGMSYRECSFPENRSETDARVIKMKQEKTHTGLWKKRLRHKSGKPIWVRMTTSLVHSEGDYLYSIDVVEDITQQHKLEQQLRQAQKMESIGILAGGIAHDFNNILGSILGFTQMALLDSPPNSKTRQRMEQVFKAANLAKDLVRQILTFSRRSDDSPQVIQVAPIIKETLKFLKALLPANIEIRQDLADLDGTVMADPTQIHQVLMNLCTNGAQAMAPGGGILSVGLFRQVLGTDDARENDLAPGSYVVISVSDTGVGIESHLLDRIFEPYYTTKQIGEGTGMGLAVVHGIVKEYEGGVIVDSLPGESSIFRVYLPKTQTKKLSLPKVAANITGGRERILFIDDNLSLLTVGREMLEHLGYQVETFSDPIQALERITKGVGNFHGVITDYTMPKMSGVALADRILELDQKIPVILSTGNSKSLNFEQLLHSGIHSILIKPLILEELAPALRTALNTGIYSKNKKNYNKEGLSPI